MYRNLNEFIRRLDAAGEIRYVDKPDSRHLEISRITDGESKSPAGGKALYFRNVRDSQFPVATNLCRSPRRIPMALGVERLDDLADRVREYIGMAPPKTLRDAVNVIPMAVSATRWVPRRHRGGRPPCQEVVVTGDAVDLSRLPVLHCWPKDAGPFVTLPLVFTRSPVTGKRNVGMYRLQIFDRNTTGMHWHVHKDGSHYFREYAAAGRRMPVAVAIGADPATIYAATAPMPRGIDEMLLAGFIRRRPVRMARCVTVDMEVPAEAEFVLEGYVDPEERRREGPFGDHTGYYSLADDYPVFHVTAVTHRKNPVYAATLVGRPPMEDCYLAKATERLFLPMLQTVMPEIRDYWFPWEGVFHNIVVVAIDKAYPGHAQKVMSGLWGQGQMSFSKAIVVVDGDVDPSDATAVTAGFNTRFEPAADITITKGILDVLDHSSPHPNFGNKIGIDLTRRFPGEPPRAVRGPARPIETDVALLETIRGVVPAATACRRLKGVEGRDPDASRRVVAVAVNRTDGPSGRAILDALLAEERLAAIDTLVLFDAVIELNDPSLMLWKLFNNTDPGRDIRIDRHRLGIDATIKGPADGHAREWPDELRFDDPA